MPSPRRLVSSRPSAATPELRDTLGTLHERAGAEARIVCLVPSITELLCDLGLARQLVGRTGFCIHPGTALRDVAKVGGTKDVNLDKIRRLAPTHLIVNVDENEKPTVEALAAFVPHVIVTHPQTPRDNLALFRLLGGVFGADVAAEALCTQFEKAYAVLTGRPRPLHRVLYLIWSDPWMTVSRDTYIANTLALIGWRQVGVSVPDMPNGPGAPARYPVIDDLEQAAAGAQTILLSSEPYRFTADHVAALARRFPDKKVRLLDGEMTSWYGSRAIRGLRYLGALGALG